MLHHSSKVSTPALQPSCVLTVRQPFYPPMSIQLICDRIDRVNGVYACEQPETLNDLLKG